MPGRPPEMASDLGRNSVRAFGQRCSMRRQLKSILTSKSSPPTSSSLFKLEIAGMRKSRPGGSSQFVEGCSSIRPASTGILQNLLIDNHLSLNTYESFEWWSSMCATEYMKINLKTIHAAGAHLTCTTHDNLDFGHSKFQ